MKSFGLILASIFLVVAAEKPVCDRYNCTIFDSEDQCTNMIQNEEYLLFELKECGDNKICNVHLENHPDFCNKTRLIQSRYPGEFCTSNEECFGLNCNNSICIGAEKGKECDNDVNCHAGLYCDTTEMKCTEVLGEYAACDSTKKCGAALVCNLKNCTRIGSLKEGELASAPAACKTFFTDGKNCVKGPVLVRAETDKKEGPIECPGKCMYKYGEKSYEEACVCGRTEYGQSFCNPGKGELSVDDYLSYASTKADDKETPCHVERGLLCMTKDMKDMGSEYYKALIAYNKMTRWAMYENNTLCVKKILNSEYWDAVSYLEDLDDDDDKFGLYLFLGVAIGAVVVIAILLLVIYLKKSKTEDDTNEEPLKVAATNN